MEILKTELLFSVPLSEDKMHSSSPIRWKVGGLVMETNLFTYHKLELFNAYASMIKMYEAQNRAQYTLQQFLELLISVNRESQKENEDDAKRYILDGLIDAKEAFGHLPESVVELIVVVSKPADLVESYHIYSEWHEQHTDWGIIPIFEEWEHSQTIREKCLTNFLKYHLDIDCCLDLLETIQRVNVTIKKKHLGIKTAEKPDALAVFKNRLSSLYQRKDSQPKK